MVWLRREVVEGCPTGAVTSVNRTGGILDDGFPATGADGSPELILTGHDGSLFCVEFQGQWQPCADHAL